MKISRKEAKAQGLRFYRGKVCARHPELNGERYVSTGGCTECVHEKARKRRAEHPEKFREYSRKWCAANPEAAREKSRKYRAANLEAVRAKDRANKRAAYAANPEVARERSRGRYHALYAANPGYYAGRNRARKTGLREQFQKLPLADQAAVNALYQGRRQLSKLWGVPFAVDHCTSLKRGGLHAPDNLRIVKASENAQKHSKNEDEFAVTFELRYSERAKGNTDVIARGTPDEVLRQLIAQKRKGGQTAPPFPCYSLSR